MADKTKAQLESELADALKLIESQETGLATIAKERDEARAESANLAEENAALKTALDNAKAELSALRSSLSASTPPPPPASDLPEGITAEMVTAKIKESGNQFSRAQALSILTRHRDRAKAS